MQDETAGHSSVVLDTLQLYDLADTAFINCALSSDSVQIVSASGNLAL